MLNTKTEKNHILLLSFQYSPADSGIFDSSPILQHSLVVFAGIAREL